MTPEEKRKARMARIKARALKGHEHLANTLLTRDISSYANNTNSTPSGENQKPGNDSNEMRDRVEQAQNNKVSQQKMEFNATTAEGGNIKRREEGLNPILSFETKGQNNTNPLGEVEDEDERELLAGNLTDKNEVKQEEDVFTRFKKMREKERKRVILRKKSFIVFKASHSSKSI